MNAEGIAVPRKASPDRADDDTPEVTAQRFDKAKPASKVLPRLLGNSRAAEPLLPKRGRPPLDNPKEHVKIRLDPDAVLAFKSQGRSWQTRVNSALRQWLRKRARKTHNV